MARDKRLETKLTAEELALIIKAADEAGIPVSVWLRMVALAAAKRGTK
jgi:uncharacterized protein (DUF1778 family)